MFSQTHLRQTDCPRCTTKLSRLKQSEWPTMAEEAAFIEEKCWRASLHARYAARLGDPSLNGELLDLLAGRVRQAKKGAA